MIETTASLLARLQSERDKTLAVFSALKEAEWTQVLYTGSSTWTFRDLLAHITSAEGEFLRLFRDVQAGGSGTPVDFLADEFNAAEQERFRKFSSQQLLTEFQKRRTAMMDWVASLTPADLEKTGKHPVLGELSLGDLVKSLTLHEHLHVRDLRRLQGVA
jgi:hypothetical protein